MPLRMHHLAIVIDIRRKGAELMRTGGEQQKVPGLTAPDFGVPPSQKVGWFIWLGALMVLFFVYCAFPITGTCKPVD
jgi:hypothetical protein